MKKCKQCNIKLRSDRNGDLCYSCTKCSVCNIKISPWTKSGKCKSCIKIDKCNGENNNYWKGDNASYSEKHKWIKRNYGKANKCENEICPVDNPRYFHWANLSGTYKREMSDWKQMCVSCHQKFDNGDYCKNGHKLIKENIYISPSNPYARRCLICKRKRRKEWGLKQKKLKMNMI